MDNCIISTAQHARPKVIHINEPVRAQLMSSSVEVTRKPLSASSLLISPKNGSGEAFSLAPAGMINEDELSLICIAFVVEDWKRCGSIPLERALLPFIYEADCQNAKENHHRSVAEPAQRAE